MPLLTFVFGLLMIAIGLAGYFLPETSSPTALIPVGFGVIVGAMGVLSFKPSKRKLCMHIAMLLALLGAGATAKALPKVITAYGIVFSGDANPDEIRAEAILAQSAFAIVCILLLLLGIRSFIAARKKSA